MDEDNNSEDTPAEGPDEGRLQDLEISFRFLVNQLPDEWQRKLALKFRELVAAKKAKVLQDVCVPFDLPSDEMREDATQKARARYFAKIRKLRPTFLRFFHIKKSLAKNLVCDLGDPSTDDLIALDAFLTAAFRFNMQK